jgi:DNA-directed RNA polymerase alpha subunit
MNIFESVDKHFGAVVAKDPIKGKLHVGYSLKELRALPIRKAGFSEAVVICLERSRIYDLGQLTALTQKELLQIKGLGDGNLLAILKLLRLLNLRLKTYKR